MLTVRVNAALMHGTVGTDRHLVELLYYKQQSKCSRTFFSQPIGTQAFFDHEMKVTTHKIIVIVRAHLYYSESDIEIKFNVYICLH